MTKAILLKIMPMRAILPILLLASITELSCQSENDSNGNDDNSDNSSNSNNDNDNDNMGDEGSTSLCQVEEGDDWQLVWSDEFDGPNLTVDRSRWTLTDDDGCPHLCGFGNNELQYYSPDNATIDSALGNLIITAKEEQRTGPTGMLREYTSAKLASKGQGDWKYGIFEVRARLPEGQGIWPAIWMLPTDYLYGGWPLSGEIDIMEYLGHQTRRVYATIHYGGGDSGHRLAPDRSEDSDIGTFNLDPSEPPFSESYHTFRLIWSRSEFEWCLDGESYFSIANQANGEGAWFTSAESAASNPDAPFDQEFHLILNLAVGGNWPGRPNEETSFPQRFYVDYVRVYQQSADQ